ncbi:MAG TPA: transposase [Flavobacteriales bacterium]|nr:transposase [Flavobacteriales bacterium]
MSSYDHLLDDPFYDEDAGTTRTRRNLPHWSQDGKLYFVTWRLADSLSSKALLRIEMDRRAWVKLHGDKPVSEMEHMLKREWYRLFHHRVQQWLDAGHGSCLLRRPEACRIVVEALHHFHGERYHLGSFAIAGNHLHVLVAPKSGVELSSVIHSWKSFTSNGINKALARTGRLWMDEYFDRILRNQMHLERVEAYIAAHKEQGAYVEQRAS